MITLTVQLEDDAVQRLRRRARREGVDPAALAARLLAEATAEPDPFEFFGSFASDEVARALEQIDQEPDSVVTSVRVPKGLRQAAQVLQEAGLISSWSDLLVQAARDRLEAIAHGAGLDEYYAEHPDMRPSIAEVALALARMDASELAERPELIEQAATELTAVRPDATGDDVLTYATALLAHQSAA